MTLKEKAPDGLIPWIKEQKDINWPEYLIYKAGYTREPITGIKMPCADTVCTACGKRMLLDRAYGVRCECGNATFGIGWTEKSSYTSYGSGKEARCPECGAKVTVLHTSAAKNLRRYVWPMSLERAEKDLVCYLWRVERITNVDGTHSFYADPWEAVIFGEKRADCYKHWFSWFYGRSYPDNEWTCLSETKDRFFDIELVYCPEGIASVTEGSFMENSKLELYMAVKGEYLFPIVWLRLYQRRHKAETLMTCGAAKLTAGIIAEEKVGGGYGNSWTSRLDCLKDLDWRQTKPAEILRVNKQELPYFIARHETITKDGVHRLRVIQEARKKGYAIRPGDETGTALRREDQLNLIENGIMPSRVTRYLDKQYRRYKEKLDFWVLKDYWRMARQLGMNLNEKDERWPQNLSGKHDELVKRINDMREEELRKEAESRAERFVKRYEAMSRYSWEHNGILIRPAASETELQAEGKALSHCVATYAKSHASGELTIFFIRRSEEPEKSWYTLTFIEKNLSVRMNLGNHNCATTPEVKAFETAWLAWVRGGCKREKKQEVTAA